MRKAITRDDITFKAYMELFEFHKAYGIPEKSEKYWDEVVKKSSQISERYKGTEMEEIISNHLVALMNKLNREVEK